MKIPERGRVALPARRVAAFVAMLAWMGIIFYLSHQQPEELAEFGAFDFAFKKGAHFLGYAVLGLLAVVALAGWRGALAIVVVYAISDEFHQTFIPGRMGSVTDVCLDTAGGATMLAVRALLYRE